MNSERDDGGEADRRTEGTEVKSDGFICFDTNDLDKNDIKIWIRYRRYEE